MFENNEKKISKAEGNEVELEKIVSAAEEEERQVQKGNFGRSLFQALIQLFFFSLYICEMPVSFETVIIIRERPFFPTDFKIRATFGFPLIHPPTPEI